MIGSFALAGIATEAAAKSMEHDFDSVRKFYRQLMKKEKTEQPTKEEA